MSSIKFDSMTKKGRRNAALFSFRRRFSFLAALAFILASDNACISTQYVLMLPGAFALSGFPAFSCSFLRWRLSLSNCR
jgi:hypothetical protein